MSVATPTQYARIIRYLRTHREATIMELIKQCGTTSPHRRFAELRDRGYSIQGRWVDHKGKRIKRYWLDSKRSKVAA